MLGNWLRRKIRNAGAKAGAEDLDRFVLSLKGQSDDDLSMLVALATLLRGNFRSQGYLPDRALGVGMPLPEEEMAEFQLKISKVFRIFQEGKQQTDAAGTMVWLHSLRALNYPELRLQGRMMWAELQRGFDGAETALEDVCQITGKSVPPLAREELRFIPDGLEPFDT